MENQAQRAEPQATENYSQALNLIEFAQLDF